MRNRDVDGSGGEISWRILRREKGLTIGDSDGKSDVNATERNDVTEGKVFVLHGILLLAKGHAIESGAISAMIIC